MEARHSGSIEGKEKAGPQMCSSRTMMQKGLSVNKELDQIIDMQIRRCCLVSGFVMTKDTVITSR